MTNPTKPAQVAADTPLELAAVAYAEATEALMDAALRLERLIRELAEKGGAK